MSTRTQAHLPEAGIFLTEAELAARWRHSLRTLQRWRAAGYGPPYLRIGSRIVYRRAAIEAFEATHLDGRT